jgi:hypothetical protein
MTCPCSTLEPAAGAWARIVPVELVPAGAAVGVEISSESPAADRTGPACARVIPITLGSVTETSTARLLMPCGLRPRKLTMVVEVETGDPVTAVVVVVGKPPVTVGFPPRPTPKSATNPRISTAAAIPSRLSDLCTIHILHPARLALRKNRACPLPMTSVMPLFRIPTNRVEGLADDALDAEHLAVLWHPDDGGAAAMQVDSGGDWVRYLAAGSGRGCRSGCCRGPSRRLRGWSSHPFSRGVSYRGALVGTTSMGQRTIPYRCRMEVTQWKASQVDNSILVDELRDRSFAAYVKATVGAKGFGLRTLAAARLCVGLIVSQGMLGLIIVVAALIGGTDSRLPPLAAMGTHFPCLVIDGVSPIVAGNPCDTGTHARSNALGIRQSPRSVLPLFARIFDRERSGSGRRP